MSEALIGLLGAVVGASAALGTAVLIEWHRARIEDRRWLRGKVEEAYDSALHHLLQVEGMGRTELAVESGELVGLATKEGTARWFDALVEARYSLHRLVVYCSDASRKEVEVAVVGVEDTARRFLTGSGEALAGLQDLSDVRQIIMECATRDLREGKAL